MTQPSIFHRIATLLPELEELERHPGGPRSPRSGSPAGTDTSRLPFGIIIDDPDEPADALTTDGIAHWAAVWAGHITDHYADPDSTPQPDHSLTILHHAFVNRKPGDYWDDVLEEAQRIYDRAARRTGHGHAHYGWCSCGGSVWQKCTDEGLTDWMVCDGPAEHFFKDAAHYAATQRGMARAVTQEGRYWVTRRAVRTIWPGLKEDTLKKWVKRGTVAKRGREYDLAQINARMNRHAQQMAA